MDNSKTRKLLADNDTYHRTVEPLRKALMQTMLLYEATAYFKKEGKGRLGAYATLVQTYGSGVPIATLGIGKLVQPMDFILDCYRLSYEKIFRMNSLGHADSYMSRNPKENKFGGALLFDMSGWSGGLSGLREPADTAVLGCAAAIANFQDPNNTEATIKLFDDGGVTLDLFKDLISSAVKSKILA